MDTRTDYVAMVRESLAEIQRRLDDPPTFRELANKACLSPYHFHRIFRALAGESPAEIIRRFKLERAAWQIRNSDCSITEVAFDAGYATHEAFTKAFQSEFQVPPSVFRTGQWECTGIRSANSCHFTPSGFTYFHPVDFGDLNMKTETIEMPAMRVAVVRHKGPFHEIGSAFEKLGMIAGPKGLFALSEAFGVAIYLDDPDTKAAEELESLAGVIVTEEADIDGLEEFRLPAGKYFKATHEGHYSGLGNAWGEVCGKLIPEAGLQFGKGYPFEMYLNDCRTVAPDDLLTDIYVPIA